MKSIHVSLGERSYNITFGTLGSVLPISIKSLGFPSQTKILIVTSQALMKAGHLAYLEKTLARSGLKTQSIVLPNGESVKNWDTIKKLLSFGAQFGLDRKSLVIGLGGGVITDMAGFFAATYMRGISFVSIPTTILGMVDAAIGGKTGVDLPEGKNLAGAFWQPRLVWIDTAFLKTLPDREWRTGFAEVIKYGVIKDAAFFHWLENQFAKKSDLSKWSLAEVEKAIVRSAQIKAIVVSGDEREKPLAGGREILNFGHTGGHALEAAYNYHGLSHGEAISIGMNLAGRLALAQKMWAPADHLRMIVLLRRAGLPTTLRSMAPRLNKLFWSALSKDKKHVSGQLRFVLPLKIGRVTVKSGISPVNVKKALKEITYDH